MLSHYAKKVHVFFQPEYERTIASLKPGEGGYTVPWAFDPKNGTLNENFSVYSRPGGTVELCVVRNPDYSLSINLIPSSTYKW